ncbi:hypothetical protein BsWGS_21586 [Bradybaena similaris]
MRLPSSTQREVTLRQVFTSVRCWTMATGVEHMQDTGQFFCLSVARTLPLAWHFIPGMNFQHCYFSESSCNFKGMNRKVH